MKKPLLFIEKDWISGATCVENITNPFLRSEVQITLAKMRKKFVQQLIDEGFEITTEKENLPEDTIYLIMNEWAITKEDLPISTYKKLFDKRMFEAGGEKLYYPKSVSFTDFLNHPFFPAVFKNEGVNGGQDKFLITSMEQVQHIKKFYEKMKDVDPYKEAFKLTIFQEYIDTPTEYASYIRILMSASGDVMGASLKYANIKKVSPSMAGIFEKYFCDPNSPYYLNCENMFSYYSGGGNISFCQPRYNPEKQQVLQEHDIDPQAPKVPEEIIEISKNIVTNCNKELGILCGLDFILNKNDGHWYYLENQAFPAIDEWADTKGIKTSKKRDLKGYVKMMKIDLLARHEALMLFMKKKENINEKSKTLIKR